MHDFIMTEDCELWDVIEDGPFIPTKLVKVGDVTLNVPKIIRKYAKTDKRMIEKNFKANKLLECGIGPNEYNKISAWEIAKEI